ncbi:MAG: hypothetical protein ACFFBH_14055 [Promethearchaeota archaeon]
MSYIIENVMLKQKIRADNVISIILFGSFLVLALFLSLIALMSIIVYPLVSLFFFGIYKIVKGFFKKRRAKSLNVLHIIFGIAFTIFSFFMLDFLFSYPNVGLAQLIYLLTFPTLLIGMAGIIKGIIIQEYLFKYRLINILAGSATIILTIMAFASAEKFFLFNIISLPICLLINVISRAIMYLSEYNLPLRLKNVKYFFYILDDTSEYDVNRKIELDKLVKK